MTHRSVTAVPDAVAHPRDERRRWCASLFAVVAIHAGAAFWLLHAAPLPAPVSPAPAVAMLVDLAPLPAAPPPPEPKPAPKPPQPVAKPVVATKPVPDVAEPQPADVVEPTATAPVTDATPSEPTAAVEAPAPRDAPSAPAGWQSVLLGHLQKHQRYPQRARSNRQQGVVYLRLTIGRGGELVASRIERGSGVAALDEEALATVERAQPLPAPPADAPRFPVELIVPMQFIWQRR